MPTSIPTKDKYLSFSSNLFGFFAIVDPANTLFGLKIPTFLLFVICLALRYKPHFADMGIIVLLILLQFVSCSLGLLMGFEFDDGICKQFILFYFLLLILCWDYKIDLFPSIVFGSLIVSIITIVGYWAIMINPDLKLMIYQFSEDHGTILMTGERTFLGVTIYAFFYRSLPLVIIPAAIFFNKFLNEKNHKKRNLFISVIFIISLFMGGNRSMLLGAFIIFMIPIYLKYKKKKFIKMFLMLMILFGLYIAWLAITDKEEESASVKSAHLISYMDYFTNNWYTLLFGTGAGSMFYSKGFESMTPITEWTYLELLRMNGVIGLVMFLVLLFRPLKRKFNTYTIKYWREVSLGYLLYMFLAGSNPNIFCSTGLLVIILLYSYASNSKYQIERH